MQAAPDRAVGFFGTIFPDSGYIGTASTGLLRALSLDPHVGSIIVFSQKGASLPEGINPSKITLIPCWAHDSPWSLFGALICMLRHATKLTFFLFNLNVTAFGRSAVSNGIGLLMPTLIRLLSRKPVVTYMHNMLETQEIELLGYHPTNIQRHCALALEHLLLRYTKVVVPLGSQQRAVFKTHGIQPSLLMIPFAEAFGLVGSQVREVVSSVGEQGKTTRVLLLGSWGPQKDLSGALDALSAARTRGADLTVSITGAINPHFPDYQHILDAALATADRRWVRFLGHVPECQVLELTLSHDLVILPYRTSGGYSGAMSLSVYCGAEVIAYDLPQLRETAVELGAQTRFVPKVDVDALANEVVSVCSNVEHLRENRRPVPRLDFDSQVMASMGRLIELAAG